MMEHDEPADHQSPRGSKVQKTNARDTDVSAGKEKSSDAGAGPANNNGIEDELKVRKESVDANAKSRETKETELLVYPLEMPEELGLPCRETGTGSIALFDTSGVDDKENGEEHKRVVDLLWKTQDWAMIVVDLHAGSKAAAKLFSRAKENCDKIRNIPLTIVLNKDDEQGKSKQQVEEILQCADSIFGGHVFIDKDTKLPSDNSFPIVVTVAAQFALLFRSYDNSSDCEDFEERCKSVRDDILDNFGYEYHGPFKWKEKATTRAEKIRIIFEELSEEGVFEDCCKQCNIQTLIRVFRDTVGTKDAQRKLLQSQLDFAMESMDGMNILEVLQVARNKFEQLNKDMEELKAFFWKKFACIQKQAFKRVKGKDGVEELATVMNTLVSYYKFVTNDHIEWNDQIAKIVQSAKSLVEKQLEFVLKMEQDQRKKTLETGRVGRNQQSHKKQWQHLFRSILHCSAKDQFMEHFEAYIGNIEDRIDYLNRAFDNDESMVGSSLDLEAYPKKLSEPNHWGHIIWTLCMFLEEEKLSLP